MGRGSDHAPQDPVLLQHYRKADLSGSGKKKEKESEHYQGLAWSTGVRKEQREKPGRTEGGGRYEAPFPLRNRGGELRVP